MPRFNATTAPWREPAAAPLEAEATPAAPAKPAPQLTVLPPPTAAAPAPTAPPAAATPAAKPKLNFGGLGKKATVAEPKSQYPILPDPDGEMAIQAEAFLEAHAKLEAAEGAKEAARGVLLSAARPFHFQVNHGRADIPSSVSVLSPKGEVRVTFKDAYKKLDEVRFEKVKGIIGEQLANLYLTQSFEFTIKSDAIPEAKMQNVIDAITSLAETHGITSAVTVAACYKPTNEWHTARFRLLTPEQNLRLEREVDGEKGYCQGAVGVARGKK